MIFFDMIETDSEKIDFIQNIGNLIKDDTVTPERLNECLANFFAINRYLIDVYESVESEKTDLKTDYDIWYAEKSKESENRLSIDMPKSKTISDAKIETDVIVNNRDEYKSWQNKLNLADRRRSFYYRILESWKANSKHIIELSQNMRSELMVLNIEKRANEDITKETIVRHLDVTECDEVEKPLKKIKKVNSNNS